jgi:glycosyltransferase involved in cell wall biosynthesis
MGDYHRARWRALQEISTERVFAADLGSSDKLYHWETTNDSEGYFLLSNKDPKDFDFMRLVRFIGIVRREGIRTVCIAGYGKPEYILFILFSWLTRRKVILFAESWYPSNPVIDWLKSALLRLTCAGFLVSGSRAFDHFSRQLRIPPHRIRTGYSVVDNEHFRKDGHKQQHPYRLLCIARFSEEKNLDVLIQAFVKSQLAKKDWELHLVGGGPLLDSLETAARSHTIRLQEWIPYKQLPDIYTQADIFILPSKFEPWGLVVNEAMAAGLPVLLSDAVGCAPDLLKEDFNGWNFHPDEVEDIVRVLNLASLRSRSDLAVMGARSRNIIERFSLSVFAMNLKDLINQP